MTKASEQTTLNGLYEFRNYLVERRDKAIKERDLVKVAVDRLEAQLKDALKSIPLDARAPEEPK